VCFFFFAFLAHFVLVFLGCSLSVERFVQALACGVRPSGVPLPVFFQHLATFLATVLRRAAADAGSRFSGAIAGE
jgi:hypothetical protein